MIVRGAEVAVRAVPTPFVAVVPKLQRMLKPVHPTGEKLEGFGVASLDGEVVKAKEAKQKTVEHAGQRIARIFFVERMSLFQGSDPSILHVLFEDQCGSATKIEQMCLACHPIAADEGAHRQPLSHG